MLASRQRPLPCLRTSFVAKLRKEVQSLSHDKRKNPATEKSVTGFFGVGEKIRTSAPETRPTSLAGTPLTADLSIPTSVTDLRLQTTVFASLLYNYTQFFLLCQ